MNNIYFNIFMNNIYFVCRWANHGFDFLSMISEPAITNCLSTDEFQVKIIPANHNWLTDWPTDRPTDCRLTVDWLTNYLSTDEFQVKIIPVTPDWLTIDWLTDRSPNSLTHLLTDCLANRLADWLTHSSTDSLTDWLTHWSTAWLTNWLTFMNNLPSN